MSSLPVAQVQSLLGINFTIYRGEWGKMFASSIVGSGDELALFTNSREADQS